MNHNVKPSDRVQLLDVVDPQSSDSALSTAWVDVSKVGSLMALIQVGAMTSTGTVDAKIEQATSDAGAGAKDVTGFAITQLTEAGTDDDKQAIINCPVYELDGANSFTFARLTITPATAASLVSGALFGFDATYVPADHVASLAEAV